MKLRSKAILITGITFICIIALLYFASSYIIINGFIKIENESVEKNVNRALDAISDDINQLSTSNRDWAWWDDTYAFIEDHNTDYIETNTHAETWSVLGINLILYLNSSGDMVLGKGYDLKEDREISIPESFLELLDRGNPAFKHPDANSNITGIILLPEGPMMISSMPILTGEGQGPVRGTLIFGRYLDDDELDRLSSITHMSLALHRVEDEKLPDDFKAVLPIFSSNEQIVIRPQSDELVAGYTVLNDINGVAALILRAELPRGVYNQGRITVMYFLISVISVSLIFGGISIRLIEKQVLSRILRLNNDVTLIKKSKNPSGHVVVDQDDEISSLAISINDTLVGLKQSQEEQRKAQDELEKHRDHLENLVEKRTKELKIINDQLRKEIKERIGTEDELQKSEIKTRSILEAIPDMLFTINKAAVFVGFKAAKGMEPIMPPEAFLGKKVSDVLPPQLAEEVLKHIENVLMTATPVLFEYKLPQKDSLRDYEAKILRISEDEVLGIVSDITERKKFEYILKEKEERFRSVVQSVNDAIITMDSKGDIIFWNNGAHKIFGYDYEEVIGKPVTFLMPEIYRDAHRNGLKRFAATGEPHIIGKTVELSGTRKDSTQFPLGLSLSSWKAGEMIYFTGILRDITERKLAEDNIKKSLQEKEVLLREIHHRVKNNMQIVSSLLMLQSRNIEDKKYKDVFVDSQNRILSMALIHEKLYQSGNLAEINFKEYINGIVSNISESYGQRKNIKLDINIENIPIKIDYAVPCGLIINEIVTNSFKYAFPDERQGKIKISAKSNDDNMIQFSISDDGIGIAKDMDIRKTKSLGLQLVTGLAENQLHGQITLNRENGTEFQINFRQEK
jgi:PAS domain S-box-containing protein